MKGTFGKRSVTGVNSPAGRSASVMIKGSWFLKATEICRTLKDFRVHFLLIPVHLYVLVNSLNNIKIH